MSVSLTFLLLYVSTADCRCSLNGLQQELDPLEAGVSGADSVGSSRLCVNMTKLDQNCADTGTKIRNTQV